MEKKQDKIKQYRWMVSFTFIHNKYNITSNVEFHNRYNIIIIPLLEQDQIIIITDIIKKKLSKHKKINKIDIIVR